MQNDKHVSDGRKNHHNDVYYLESHCQKGLEFYFFIQDV